MNAYEQIQMISALGTFTFTPSGEKGSNIGIFAVSRP
jgi:hypothetical protein